MEKQEYLKIIAMECVCNDVKFKIKICFQKTDKKDDNCKLKGSKAIPEKE